MFCCSVEEHCSVDFAILGKLLSNALPRRREAVPFETQAFPIPIRVVIYDVFLPSCNFVLVLCH
jgi:hypothetical protein